MHETRRTAADVRRHSRFRPENGHSLYLDFWSEDLRFELDERRSTDLMSYIQDGSMEPTIDITLPLEQGADGIRMIEDEVFGKGRIIEP